MRLSADVDEVAYRLRTAYVEERIERLRRVTKKQDVKWQLAAQWTKKDRQGKTIWSRLATKVIQLRLIPEMLVSVAFRTSLMAGREPPFPSMLLSQWFIDAYHRQFPRVDKQEAEKQLQLEMTILRRRIAGLLEHRGSRTLVEIQRAALLDDLITCSPLFRYCAAMSEKIEDIAADYEALAALQLTPSAEAYIGAWGDFIPRRFIQTWVGRDYEP